VIFVYVKEMLCFLGLVPMRRRCLCVNQICHLMGLKRELIENDSFTRDLAPRQGKAFPLGLLANCPHLD